MRPNIFQDLAPLASRFLLSYLPKCIIGLIKTKLTMTATFADILSASFTNKSVSIPPGKLQKYLHTKLVCQTKMLLGENTNRWAL